MKELKKHVETITDTLFHTSLSTKEAVEEIIWELVEHSMKVQQEICGGHK